MISSRRSLTRHGAAGLRYGLHMDTKMDVAAKLASLLGQLNTVIVGKEAQVRDCVACLLAGGHLLIEDVPGVGKTTLAHALSHTFGLQFSRVQFTADLMPGDLSGVAIYDRGQQAFVFHPGPDLRAGAAGRRDQPRQPQDPERAAGGDGGEAGHGRRRNARPALALLRDRHAEPARPARHLRPARVAARPLPDAHLARLPRPRGRARAAGRRRPARDAGQPAGAADRRRAARRCSSGCCRSTPPSRC